MNSKSVWLSAIALLLTLVQTFAATLLSPTEYIILDIALWVLILISVTYSTEITLSLYNVTIWYNVLVVSILMTVPQTVIAIELARAGHYTAAWLDSILSTVVDAVLATALVRRHVIGSPYIWSLLPIMVVWSVLALSINAATYMGVRKEMIGLWLVAGYVALPIWIVRRSGGGGSMPPLAVLANTFMNTVAMAVASYNLTHALYSLHMEETTLGVVSTLLATLPDLIVALIIRASFALLVNDVAGDREMVATMLASAIHDQISVPALILLVDPQALTYFPHYVALFAVVVKFALLDRHAFYYVALPASIALLFLLA